MRLLLDEWMTGYNALRSTWLSFADTDKKGSYKLMFIKFLFRETFGSCQAQIVAIKYMCI